MNEQQRDYYLAQIGIARYEPRCPCSPQATQEAQHAEGVMAVPASARMRAETNALAVGAEKVQASLQWPELQSAVAECQLCALAQSRINTVFGVGRETAELFVVGEAPGADEDQQGVPFVGRAGRLLNSLLLAAGFSRESVYIANILKCRPPGNRDPLPKEVVSCEGYLIRQIELVQPKVILAVGRIAAQNLLHTDAALATLRGKSHSFGKKQTPVIVTYHPAYLLRQPRAKAEVWKDLLQLLRLMTQ